jgi:endonuclease YncB( thermonuclease family)
MEKEKENTNTNLVRFNLNGIETEATCVDIYDGDTFDLCFEITMNDLCKERHYTKTKKGCCAKTNNIDTKIMLRMNCRLNGIDAAELKTDKGKEAKQIVYNILFGKVIKIRLGQFDKYGRVLVDIFINNESLVDKLIKDYPSFFNQYDGKTKLDF